VRVALVAQPYDGVLPPRQNSIGLILYNTAIALLEHAEVAMCMKKDPANPAAAAPFTVVNVSSPMDEMLERIAGRYPRWAKRLGITAAAEGHSAYARAAARALDAVGPDIVHVMNYYAWCSTFAGRGNRGVVLEMQSEWLSQMDRNLVRRVLRDAAGVVGVSDHIVSLFRESFPDYPGMVATAYNGVDVDVFKPAAAASGVAADEPRILFVGRLSPEKGIHILLPAFAQVLRRFPRARLDLVGPRTVLPHSFLVGISTDPIVKRLERYYDGSIKGDYQQHLDSLVTSLGLAEHVTFLGSLPHKEIVARYHNASVVVNPSYSESFGISIVEGMASAVPVVGTRIGGMKETILDGQTGFIVEPDDADALGEAIVKVLGDAALARRLGTAGRERAVACFSWKARAARLAELYRRVIAASAR
jgi:glycosyltransferase involved in cell wall biosynthesis